MNSLGIRIVFMVAFVLAFLMLLSGLWIDWQLKLIILGCFLWVAFQYGVISSVAPLRNLLMRVGGGGRSAALPETRVDDAEFNRMKRELVRKENHIRGIMDSVADSIVVTDEQGVIESVNLVVYKMFGYQSNELVGRSINVLVPELFAQSHDHYVEKYLVNGAVPMVGVERELIGRRKDASTFPVEIFLNEINLDHHRYFVATLCDITEKKNQTAILEYQALHDGLTGLANRVLFGDYLYKAIADARRDDSRFALLLMDLDRFKDINDTLGHQIGDILLKKVAGLLQKTLSEADMISRLGGDEFAILLHGFDREAAIEVALKLYEVLDLPFVVDEQEGLALHVGVSIGITLYPEHGDESAADLLRRAEVAMYCAKRSQDNYAVYDPEEDAHSLQNLALFGQLRHAVRNDQLQLYYQPKVNAKSGEASKLEVLLRWMHPKNGLISPDHFIPLAERTGLIGEITLWVIKEALAQCREWRKKGFDLSVAVNISVINLQETGFSQAVEQLLDKECREQQLLSFEITETSIMLEPERALKTLASFSDLGIRLSVDDFGTGYSSLAYLKQLPVNELKIDKSFILGVAKDADDVTLVRSMIDLAHNMGLSVVAEGVENRETCEMLTDFGCEELQGNYICPPFPAKILERWLIENLSTSKQLCPVVT
ncbi:MAG: EAL domain-containing protein [Gammaproteobacteria bacterium]|nr:EAL domain-containing protein [Gammaproteobacteria bacterium]